MLRRAFLKLLGAAIAVPIIGWPARRVARWSRWNLWVGGDDGRFDDPRCWSHRRVPGDGSSIVLDGGILNIPQYVDFENVALVGGGTLRMQSDSSRLAVSAHVRNLTFTDSAALAGCTIGKQGRAL